MSDLLFDVSGMREADARVDRTVPAGALSSDADVFRISAPIVLAASIHKIRQQYRVAGRVSTTLEVGCSRCLEPFALVVDEAIDVLFLPHGEHAGEVERQVEDDDLSTAYYQDAVLDLGQLLQEQLYLVVPMKPLCSESCRGLCGVCGVNLNTASCSDHPVWVDPRLAVLDQLRRDK
jgi:uncharacterized protein